MRTLIEIKQEIDRLSDRRRDVMRALSEGYDATLKTEHGFAPEVMRVEVEENVGKSATYEWRP